MANLPSLLKKLSSKPMFLFIGIAAIAAGTYFFTAKASDKKRGRVNPAFASYISAYTSGQISRESSIKIQLAGNFADSSKIGELAKVFSFEPSIKGEAKWIDATTIEFKPAEPLPSGTEYEASFLLDKIVDVTNELEEFPFHFSVIKQSFEVSMPTFEAIDRNKLIYQRVSGTLVTADAEDEKKVEQLLTLSQEGKKFNIKWEHAADKRSHHYMADSVLRKSNASEVVIKWDGEPLQLDVKGEHKLIIPALGDFSALNAKVVNDGSQHVAIYFSDPILPTQDLSGLIQLSYSSPQATGAVTTELKFIIDGHLVKCFPSATLTGSNRLQIFAGVQNILGYKLKKVAVFDLDFADNLPSVNFIGKGVIMPSSNQLRLPFEATSLSAVEVTVIKVYENNITQFLQVNDLAGSNEMIRVGRPMLKKTIRLDGDKLLDLRRTNTFSLDLDQLMRTEPGALYQVKLSFSKAHSLYRCNGIDTTQAANDDEMTQLEENVWDGEAPQQADASFWDYAEEDYDWSEYNWNERDNPCNNSYYTNNRAVTRNIMASDIGLIAKKGSQSELHFFATNLLSTKPMSGVSIELLDYQQQLITSANTNGEGMVKISYTRKPYLAIAKYKEQRAYLKIDDGSSLSLSQFDVSGEQVQKGLKGFIYGERGVWRPGDSLYLTFILEDKLRNLPKGHPVTFELYNPLGSLSKRLVKNDGLNGFYDFKTCTDLEAPTGVWIAKVKVGGSTFSKTIRVETVMPNRLKIELNFPKPYLQKGESVSTKLKSRWLHGAIADGLEAKVEATLSAAVTSFKRFPDFVFDNPTKRFSAEANTIFEGKLDENGEANLNIDLNLEAEPAGMLNANLVTKVFEPGGNFSVDRFQIPYYPYNAFIGLKLPKGDVARGMLLTDTNHTVQIVLVNQDGSLKRGTSQANVKLYKINWRWWWDRSEDDLSNYANSEEYQSLMDENVTLNNGKGNFTLRVNYPDWGRYLLIVKDENGHSSGKAFYMDWPGWAGRAQREGALDANVLNFSLNKNTYIVGEKATLTLPTPQAGRALLSIENGSGIVETHWIEAQKGQTNFSFTITKNMLPNVFAHVTLMQPHGQVNNDLPIRLYGMQAITVQDPASILKPLIQMKDAIRPDENNTITVSEASGKPMTYTLAIVDEGLLDLTRFQTPDPHKHFFAKEALGVKTWDMFDFVMGAFGSQFNRTLSIGGDEGINKKSKDNKAKRFKPAIKFIGPFHLNAGAQAQHTIQIKDYVGAVRVMVVAGYEGAYGFTEKSVPVKKPLMILATLPRVLRPGENMQLPISVFAMDNGIKNVQVKVSTNNLLSLKGGSTKSITFTKPGDEVLRFDNLEVKNLLGIAKIKIEASAGNEKATYEMELQVSNPNPYENLVYEGTMEANKSWSTAYKLAGIEGTNTLNLEVSSIPPINLEKRLRDLIQYPHGCVEQTTSAVFPQIVLNRLTDLHEGWKKEIDVNVKAAIHKLKGFQNNEGGFSYWQGESQAQDWASSYVGHFLIEAQQAGYSLPLNVLSNWKRYQKSRALLWMRNGDNYHDLEQAYRLYTLALAKAPEIGAMNRLKELPDLSNAARWRLAAAYALIGNKDIGKNLIAKEKLSVQSSKEEQEFTYGSNERDEALMLETLTLLGETNKAYTLLQKVCANLNSNSYLSTQSCAYSLLSIASLTGKFNSNKVLEFKYSINGKTSEYRSNNPLASIKLPITAGSNLKVENKSGQLLFTRLISRGQPAIGKQTPAATNLNLEVTYKDMNGSVISPLKIEQGKDFKMEVTVSNPGLMGNYNDLAMSLIIPSGWEIHNTRLDNNQTGNYATPRYQDLRDDRVYNYFDLAAKQKATFVVLLNASYLGKFYLPGIVCESMYKGQIQARTEGQWINVVPKENTVLSKK